MDGRLLAQAREEKEKIRRRSIAEDDRRHKAAYARIPQLGALDGRIAALVGEVAASVLGSGRPVEDIRRESLELQAQRAELLTENGWPMDWLDGAWACPKCRDTGYVGGKPCACLLELYERARARDLSALLKLGDERFETFDLDWYGDEPAPGSEVSPRQQMRMVLGFCRDYAEHFGPKSVSLLFRGGTGLGKTFLSACIARVVSEKGFSVVYETTVAALAAFENQKFRSYQEDTAQSDERVRQLLTCDLLILDDLGTEMVTEFSKSALYTLINTRLLDNKKTVISTNLSEQEMERLYTPQICSRLKGEYQDLRFVGTDIRMLRKERGL
jgi:DNA replication protein DnaC